MNKLTPPSGYISWLAYAVATMDARGACLDRIFSDENDVPSQDEVRAIAIEELNHLKRKTVMPWICILENWQIELSERLGRSAESIVEGNLLSTDFSNLGVLIRFEDGTDLTFRHAFFVCDTPADGANHRVAIFTEHCGYHEFWIGPNDRISSVPETTNSAERFQIRSARGNGCEALGLRLLDKAMQGAPAYAPDDGALSAKQVEALRQDVAKHLPNGKTVSISQLFGAFKDSADRSATAIDDSLKFIDESNLRIDSMEKGARTDSLVRLNVNITGELNRRLDQMAEMSGNSKSDLLRKAIVLMGLAIDENDKGNVLAVTDGNHHVLREIVGI